VIDFTLVVGVDEEHLAEWRLTWPTWARHRPELLGQPLLAVCDAARPESYWSRTLGFLGHPRVTVVTWQQPGVSQREKMLTGLTLAPAAHVRTPWFLKLDTDAVAAAPGDWLPDEWFAADGRGREPAFVASPWGYTKPADAILRLDDWGDGVPGLKGRPRIAPPAVAGATLVRHKRVISWCFFGRTAWLREVTAPCGGRLPVPSHDTFLWYCAERRGDFYRRVRMANAGWAHVACRGRLIKACQASLNAPSAAEPEPRPAGVVAKPVPRTPRHAARLVDVLRPCLPADRVVAGAEVGVSEGKTSAALLHAFPNLHLTMIDPWATYPADHPYPSSGDRCALRTADQAEGAKRKAVRRTRFAKRRRTILVEDSLRAVAGLADASLDFAFIDADHTYAAVRADVRAWWPKVRPGGVLTGHDYGARRDLKGSWGVRRAVDEWARELGLAVSACGTTHVWSVRKPPAAPADPFRRVYYLLTGAGHGPRLVASLWSLRKHFDGPVVLYTTLPESHAIGERCANDPRLGVEHRTLPHPRVRRNASYLAKVVLARSIPDPGGLFLDADTLVAGDLGPLFDALADSPFVATRFADWSSARGIVRRRLERWRALASRHADPAEFTRWLDEAVRPHPAVNAGVFAWRRGADLLEPWEALARFGHRQFICDEVALQILLPRFPHRLLDHRFNCSAVYGAGEPDARVWHFHGDKHLRRAEGRALWLPAFRECLRENPAGLADWAASLEPALASAGV
jgi:hypothetical protein